jgi:hypothetical protein
VMTDAGKPRKCLLRLEKSGQENETTISIVVTQNDLVLENGWLLGLKNKYSRHKPSAFRPIEDVPEVNLVEAYPAAFQRPLHELYTKAVQQGSRKEAVGIISEVFPGVSRHAAARHP